MEWGSLLCGFGLGIGLGVVAGFFTGSWAQRKIPFRTIPTRRLVEGLLETPATAPRQAPEGWGTMPQGPPPSPEERTEHPAGRRPPTTQEARAARQNKKMSEGAKLLTQLEAIELGQHKI